MTFVFRTSSFFVVFVITLKATTFVVGNAPGGNAADRLNSQVERLIDEAVRFRGEAREASDRVEDMSAALRAVGDRMIERVLAVVRVVTRRARSISRFAGQACADTIASTPQAFSGPCASTDWRNFLPMPKKEVIHGGYIAA